MTIALLNIKPVYISYTQFRLFLQITTAAKQTIAKAWKTNTLMISKAKNRINQAMILSKSEAFPDDASIARRVEVVWIHTKGECTARRNHLLKHRGTGARYARLSRNNTNAGERL